mmetsp:Transcript_27859/g.65476  ORF Transcript_27859/g.65476 Transcript_27859/m.65476 type:complete len:240 (-) Transcript_27859:426-1145(-)
MIFPSGEVVSGVCLIPSAGSETAVGPCLSESSSGFDEELLFPPSLGIAVTGFFFSIFGPISNTYAVPPRSPRRRVFLGGTTYNGRAFIVGILLGVFGANITSSLLFAFGVSLASVDGSLRSFSSFPSSILSFLSPPTPFPLVFLEFSFELFVSFSFSFSSSFFSSNRALSRSICSRRSLILSSSVIKYRTAVRSISIAYWLLAFFSTQASINFATNSSNTDFTEPNFSEFWMLRMVNLI